MEIRHPRIPTWGYQVLLATVAAIWGGAFIVLKGALGQMTPGWLLTLRFSLSTLVMVAIFWRRLAENLDWSHVLAGLLIGVPEGLAFLVQNVGLDGTTPGRNAFLTTTYCVMVPFINWAVTRHRPHANNVVGALLCLVGVGFLSLDGSMGLYLGRGDLLTLASAVLFALNIVAVSRVGSAHDAVTMTVVMFAVSSLICLGYSLAAEPAPDFAALTPDFWGQMAYVVLLSSVAALLIQNVAQQHVQPAKAALLLSLESVFAAFFSITLYGEALTPQLAVGFALIFAAVLVSEIWVGRRATREIESHEVPARD
ncbi:MAG: DMT family transporter [Olsenella sp.]|nr:DMT family transporter [Olsenella sp.]